MIYLIYLVLSLLFLYNTSLFEDFILFVKKKLLIITFISIFGDILYMIGGGIIAGLIVEKGLGDFTLLILLNNYGTIMIILGAFIREYFRNLRK